jgi:uncharacterized membrane protein YhfC
MNKRIILGIVAVFVAWQVLDIILHGVILASTYKATAELWRPMPEMKMGLMKLVCLVSAACFVCLYAWLVRPKSWAAGLSYGLVFGVATGIGMGFGTFCVMPIPQSLAMAWFIGTIVETAAAGLLVGWIVKETPAAT